MPYAMDLYLTSLNTKWILLLSSEELSSGSGHRSDYHIMFVPNKSLLCEMRLKDRGVFGSFTYLDELSINWFPLDSDVISLEKRF